MSVKISQLPAGTQFNTADLFETVDSVSAASQKKTAAQFITMLQAQALTFSSTVTANQFKVGTVAAINSNGSAVFANNGLEIDASGNLLATSFQTDSGFGTISAAGAAAFASLAVDGTAFVVSAAGAITAAASITTAGAGSFGSLTVGGVAPQLVGPQAYSVVSPSAGTLTIDFSTGTNPNQQWNLSTGPHTITFAGSNWPGNGKCADVTLVINNTAGSANTLEIGRAHV